MRHASGFFVSNDHYFYNGLGRQLETKYGPFSWASSIVYCTETKGDTVCKQVSPGNSHAYANGILLLKDGKTLAVDDVVDGSVSFYDVNPETKMLSLKHKIVSDDHTHVLSPLLTKNRHSARLPIICRSSLIREI